MFRLHPVIGTVAGRVMPGVLALLIAADAGAQQGVLGTGGIRGLVRDSMGQAIIGNPPRHHPVDRV